MTEKTVRILIDGMTCAHCEDTVETALSGTEGIAQVKVSYIKGLADLAYDAEVVEIDEIKEIIRSLGYTPVDNKEDAAASKKKKLSQWLNLVGVLIILFAVYFILNRLGVFGFANIFPQAGEGTALGMLFVIGLLTSVHCVAMCGGINISQCINRGAAKTGDAAADENVSEDESLDESVADEKIFEDENEEERAVDKNLVAYESLDESVAGGNLFTDENLAAKERAAVESLDENEAVGNLFEDESVDENLVADESIEDENPDDGEALYAASASKKKFDIKTFRSSLLYNLGRVISYTVIGFIVGAIGSVLAFSDTAKGVVSIVAGVLMIIMGLNMLGVLPFLRKLSVRMPKFITKPINKLKAKNNSPFIVGLLNGLMPCGPLQTMQIYALSTGSPFLGAFSMFLFSLGTVPLMFAVGALGSLLTKKVAKKIMAAASALVIVLGMVMFGNGAGLSGLALPEFLGGSGGGTAVEAAVDYENNVQTVEFDLQPNSYNAIRVKRGVPVVWTIRADADNLNGCNGEIKVGKLGISKKLEIGDNVIEFTPESGGTIAYSCWMGMIKSRIIVYD
ncbi:MAG: sulfite exporter TauE/SafE family protein [Clostridiaceae bacterium]|jgi:sulfite exporter TauE/SafE/copper chaperone CopZ|nr:sulfite exporter TauE/SafE family protein [Clostridiaceae bacterium]